MTTKSPLAAVALSPEEEPEVQRYKDAQAELRRALEARQNPLFDPVLLAMAQGFLTPTKSGSFGEALGTAASLVGPAQAAEQKRVLEMAQLRSQLAASELEQGRKSRALKMEQDFMRGLPSAEPSAQPGQPTAGVPNAPGAVVPPENRAPGQNQYGLYPPDLIDRIRRLDPERADVLDKSNKSRMDQLKFLAGEVKTTEAGAYSIDPSGKVTFTPRPGGKEEEAFVPGVGPVSMSPDDLIKFRAARETLSQNPNDSAALREFYRLIDKYRGAAPARPAPAGAPAGEVPAAARGPMTPSEAAIRSEVDKTLALKQAESESAQIDTMMKRASGAPSRIANYSSLREIVAGPNAKSYMGVFEGSTLRDALLKLGEGAGIPEIRSVFTNLGLDKKVKAEQLAVQQRLAQVNMDMRKIMRSPGEGAQSDLETRLAIQTGLAESDTPEGFRKKVDFLAAKEKYDLDVARLFEKSGMRFNNFILNNPEYLERTNRYEQELKDIVGVKAFNAAKSEAKPSAAPAATSSEANRKLRERLGIR